MLSMLIGALLMQAVEPVPDREDGNDAIVTAANVEQSSDGDTLTEEELGRTVCKSFRVTGSRAKRERVCMTKAQWIAHDSRTRDEAGRLTNSEGVCSNAEFCSGS
ncbi:hypothetical protein [Roseibium sp.]|uniref:hypothetical protein n=1 Tax=Roseibium sp. TaxID=1936156 RepID=UPI00329883D4